MKDIQKDLEERDETIAGLEQKLAHLEGEIAGLIEENARLRDLLDAKAKAKSAKKPGFSENYSGGAQGKRSRKKGRGKGATGRRSQSDKQAFVDNTEKVCPEGVRPRDCVCHRSQCAWRIVEGRAVYIDYEIYDRVDSQTPPLPPGLRNSRSEFGIEISLIVAFLHYWVGESLDHSCQIIEFFTGLALSKSQAHSLMNQLSDDWGPQQEAIAGLIALQWVVYIDETGWKVGAQSCYTRVFSSALYVLFRRGVGRGKVEAETVLGEAFEGIGVSDDYGVYKNLFKSRQLCWAHFIRKAVKLMLQHPEETAYAEFLDELMVIYQQAVRYQKDQRLSVGRTDKVRQLQQAIKTLCPRHGEEIDDAMPLPEATFIRLQNELAGNLEKLFVFVEYPEVEPTNNRSERNVRREAEIRKGGRTSKTAKGARRRSIIVSVLMSLRTRFEKFTLKALVEEIQRWVDTGQSVFEEELARMAQANAPPASS